MGRCVDRREVGCPTDDSVKVGKPLEVEGVAYSISQSLVMLMHSSLVAIIFLSVSFGSLPEQDNE
jgi:hypothetical protein